MWTPGRLAATWAVVNGEPTKLDRHGPLSPSSGDNWEYNDVQVVNMDTSRNTVCHETPYD